MLGQCFLQAMVIEVALDTPLEDIRQQTSAAIIKLDQGDGVLVLCDIFGSTPCNIVLPLHNQHKIRLVAGVNLPMLVRVLNYVDLTLNELARKAATGGRDGIILCEENNHG
jgi:PTS system ascorbate-specific IIA component